MTDTTKNENDNINPFKAGDRVIYVDNAGARDYLTVGKVYEVLECPGVYVRVRDNEGDITARFASRFKLVEEPSVHSFNTDAGLAATYRKALKTYLDAGKELSNRGYSIKQTTDIYNPKITRTVSVEVKEEI